MNATQPPPTWENQRYAEADGPAWRRTSPWNLLLIPVGFTAWLLIWYGLFRLVWAFHAALFPAHELSDFWRAGISSRAFAPSFVMVFALLPGALGAGLLAANGLVWLIPSARRALDAEAQAQNGARFPEAMRALGRFTAWALAVGLRIALLAAACLPSLR
jgi:hypothetical protein